VARGSAHGQHGLVRQRARMRASLPRTHCTHRMPPAPPGAPPSQRSRFQPLWSEAALTVCEVPADGRHSVRLSAGRGERLLCSTTSHHDHVARGPSRQTDNRVCCTGVAAIGCCHGWERQHTHTQPCTSILGAHVRMAEGGVMVRPGRCAGREARAARRQKMCASSCWKRRTRVSPVSAPLNSLRCSTPKSASLMGSSRYERVRCANMRQCPAAARAGGGCQRTGLLGHQ